MILCSSHTSSKLIIVYFTNVSSVRYFLRLLSQEFVWIFWNSTFHEIENWFSFTGMGKGSYMMLNKITTQNETFSSQIRLLIISFNFGGLLPILWSISSILVLWFSFVFCFVLFIECSIYRIESQWQGHSETALINIDSNLIFVTYIS